MPSHPASLAREAYHKGDYRLAERLFRALCASEPQEPVWYLDLATLCITLIRFEEAEESLRLAAACSAGNAETMRQVALGYFSMFRFGEARKILEPAAAAGHLPSLLGLLLVMEREGLLEETAVLLDKAIERHPSDPELRLLRAQLLVRQGQLEAGESLVRALLASLPPFIIQSKAGYLLAGILDRTERYAEAATLLSQIKQAARVLPNAGALRKQFRDRMSMARDLAAAFSPAHISEWQDAAAEHPLAFRPALLCGHPRSGTTLLEGRIERLENVVSFDETGAFDGGALSSAGLVGTINLMRSLRPNGTALALSARGHYARSIAALHGRPFIDDPLVVDKNPSQIIQLPLWLRLLPEIRFLIALRDPRDVVVSSYFFDLPPNATSIQFLDWESTARHYAALMDLWRQLREKLPAGCWLESRYEDLVADTAGETARVAAFLGLSAVEKSGPDSSVTLHSPNYATASLPVHARSVGRWHHYEAQLASSAKWLTPSRNAFGYE